MAHSASELVLGVTKNSNEVSTCHASDPATFLAGLVVSENGSGLSLSLSDGKRIGVSKGKSLSDHAKTAVCRKGLGVPVKFMNFAHALVTITSYANLIDDNDDTINVAGTVFTAQSGAATPGTATFAAATSNTATATSLALQINEHEDTNVLVEAWSEGAVVYIRSIVAGTLGEDLDLVYDDVDGTGDSVGLTVSGSGTFSDASVSKGALVYVHDTLGMACMSTDVNATVTNMVYDSSTIFTAFDESGSEVSAVQVNMLKGV